MITTITDQGINPPEASAETDQHKKRIPLVWIAAVIGVGLLIAAIYVGGRIVTVRLHAPTQQIRATIGVPQPPPTLPSPTEPPILQPVAPVAPLEVPSPAPIKPADSTPQTEIMTPQSGERYIQVGALKMDSESARRFIQRLRTQNFKPNLAPGPNPQLMRVLIGPFDDRDLLNQQQVQLTAKGIDSFIRKY
jgi:cell division septation protein DedD